MSASRILAGRRFYAGNKPRNLGHRGAAGVTPENTMVSFRQGARDGATTLELDLHLCADRFNIVCHDETVDRTTNGTGRIDQLTLSQIKALDAGYNFKLPGVDGFPFRGMGITMPTIEEVLDAYPGMPLNIELKSGTDEQVEVFIETLRRYGRLDDGSVLIAGYEWKTVKRIRRAMPGVHTNYSFPEIALVLARSKFPFRAKAWRPSGRALQVPVQRSGIRIVTPRFVRFAHAIGAEVHVWTINDPAEMHRLLDMGVDGIFTDVPAVMREVIRARVH